MEKKKICFIVAQPGSARAFLSPQIIALAKQHDIFLVANAPILDDMKHLPLEGYHIIPIQRNISLWNDTKALILLFKYFRKMKFDAIHSVTPKAGLLTAVAGWLSRIKKRIHIFTGQVWANDKGFRKWLLKSLDKIIAKFDTHILVDSNGQRDFLISEGVIKEEKSEVLAEGSICGVNLSNFTPSEETRLNARKEFNIEDKVVYSFMGRLNKDKGISELLEAFNNILNDCPKAFLLLFGMDEAGYSKQFRNYNNLSPNNFLYYGRTPMPYSHLQAADVVVIPTYREGFGSSLIEASALKLPVITTNVYGVRDTVIDNETGLKAKMKDVKTLEDCMKKLYFDEDLRKKLGENGRKRVEEHFNQKTVTKAWVDFYSSILG